MGLNFRYLFRDGLGEGELKARFDALFTDPDVGILPTIKKTGRPPAGFSLKEAHDHLMGKRMKVSASVKADLDLYRALGYQSRSDMENRLSDPLQTRADGAGAANVSMFATVTSNTIFPILNRAADEAAAEDYNVQVADALVRDFDDNKALTKVPEGIMRSAFGGVSEGQQFPRAQANDQFTLISLQKFGEEGLVTSEAVLADNTGIILDIAATMGRYGIQQLARHVIERVQDVTPTIPDVSGAFVYKPNTAPTGTTFYVSSALAGADNGNLITSNPLATEANIAALRVRLRAMFRKDSGVARPKVYLGVTPDVLLVPDALRDVALKIIGQNLQYSVSAANGSAVAYNAVNLYYNRIVVLSSQILDETSTSTWYGGRPQVQFRRKWRRRFQVERMAGNASDEMFDSDIILKYRTLAEMEIGAIDYQYWAKNTM